MPPDLRSTMRNFATGVCVVTTYADLADGRRHDAVTVNSLTSVSLDPSLVSLCLRRDSEFLTDLLKTKKWAVSILDGDAAQIARFFAKNRTTRAAAVDDLHAYPGPQTGALVLDSPNWLECILWDSFDIGDHTMVVGEVTAAGAQRTGSPLIFLHGRYHALGDNRLIPAALTPDTGPGLGDLTGRHVAMASIGDSNRMTRSDHMTIAQAPEDASAAVTAAPPQTAMDILARATAIAPRLREQSDEIERQRRLPEDVVKMLRSTGVFRMGFSREWGGPEMTSVEQTEVIEKLSYGDASAGWCAMIGSDTGLYSAFLEESVAKEMFPNLDMITAGLLFPVGRAELVPGGYRVTGRWQFGSGITHSDWVTAGAFIYRDGQPEPSPTGDPHDSRIMMVRREQVEIIDTWHTTGLAGSGSCDYTITDVFVPDEHTFVFGTVRSGSGPLAQPEAFMRNMPGVPLGVARAALDYVREIASTRIHPGTGAAWADNYRMQVTLAECEMDYIATRTAMYDSMRRQWEVLSTCGTLDDLTPDERAALPLSRLHTFRTARSIVSRLYDLLQTASIYRRSPLDRWLRDTTTMCQHVVAQDRILQSVGAYLLGGTPEFPLCLGIVS